MLSVQVKEDFPNIDFRVIIKDPKEWGNYLKDVIKIINFHSIKELFQICRTYGFKNKENPIIFKSNGTLIGNSRDFENYCEKNFGVSNVHNSLLKTDTTTNKKLAAKEYRLKQKLEKNKKTLSEKILSKLEDSLRAGKLKMTERFYVEIVNKGITFFTKQEKSLQPSIKVPLKISRPNLSFREPEEDFDPEQAARRDFHYDAVGGSPAFDKTEGGFKEFEEKKEDKLEEKEAPPIFEEKPREVMSVRGETDKEEEIPICQEIFAKEQGICQDFNVGDFVIENIKDDYFLILNPEPLINGQCMIFQDRRDLGIPLKLEVSKTDGTSQNVLFKDYSKVMRNRKNDGSALNYEKEKTGLYERFLNIYEPLSIIDWSKTIKVVRKINAYAFVQILPFNCKNFSNFMNNMIHIIQRRFLATAKNNQEFFAEETEFYQLPFEVYWAAAKKECIFKKKVGEATFFKNESFGYNHLIAKLAENSGGKELHEICYDMICYFKDVEKMDVDNMGINIIVNKDQLFLAPLQKPILKYHDEFDIFLPPFSYLGYIHRSTIKFVWPDTVNENTIFDDPDAILDVLKKTGEK